jgi:hypothetical protein
VLRSATTAWIVAGVLALAVVGLSIALATTNANTAPVAGPLRGSAGRFGGGSGASGRAPGSSGAFGGSGFSGGSGTSGGFFGGGGGVFGTVASVASGSFTVTDFSGQTITVDEQSSTVYDSGPTSATSSAVVTGARVAVQGTRSGNTVTATRVIVLPTGGFGSAPAS